MRKNPRVVVLSGWGRGHWLARELTSIGYEVSLVDLTSELGRLAPEDVEGPYGYFQVESLLESQMARLDSEDYAEPVEEGFSIWLKSGPIDFRGPLSLFLLEKNEIPQSVLNFVQKYDQFSERDRTAFQRDAADMEFYDRWLGHLAQSLANPKALDSVFDLGSQRPLPFFSPYFLRRVSRRGHEKSMEWIKSKNIPIFSGYRLEALDLNRLCQLRLGRKGENFVTVESERIVCSLSSAELERVNPLVRSQFFSHAVVPELFWLRYRLSSSTGRLVGSLPKQFLMIEDLALPWSHTNALMAHRTASGDQLDIWLRLPYARRFEKDYLTKVGAEIVSLLQTRLPGEDFQVAEMPAEFHIEESVLGLPRYAHLAPDSFDRWKTLSHEYLHFDCPELYETLDWSGQFRHQRAVFLELLNWKNEYELRYNKYLQKEQARVAAEQRREQK